MDFYHSFQSSVREKLNIWIILILLLGSLLRLIDLGGIPSGFQYDEIQSAYNGFLISKHLKNIQGEFLPTDIDYFRDFRPAFNAYLSSVTVKLLGNHETSGRLPSALLGIITILLVYLLTLKFFQKKQIAILAALLIAISPYHVIFSRSSSDSIIDVTLSIFAILISLKYLGKGDKKLLPLILVTWIFSFYTYQTGRIMIPILSSVIIIIDWLKTKSFSKSKWLIFTLIIFLIFPLGYSIATKKGSSRFNQVSVFANPEIQRSLNQIITESGVVGINPTIVRVFNNKLISYSMQASQNYLYFFSPENMLFDKNVKPLRYKIPQVGLITITEYLGLLAACYFFIKGKNKIKSSFPFIAILIAPLPAAITSEDFQRSIYLIPYWQILASFGLYNMIKSITSKKLLLFGVSIVIVVVTYQALFFAYQYFLISPVHEPFYRTYERKELAIFLGSNENMNKNVLLSEYDGTYIYYLYFNKLDIFSLKYKKPTKYFEGDFTMVNMTFKKNRCLGGNDYLENRYDMSIEYEDCKKFPFLAPVKEFRRKDGSLVLVAYNINGYIYDLQRQYQETCEKDWGPSDGDLLQSANSIRTTINNCN
ncbi:MAG: glycosyltransferase family 39 protein [Patescibacteria group bacterium]